MDIVVIGAGYAGTVAANRLNKKVPDARITVVNPRGDFIERVRLHEQIAGSGAAARPLAEMLGERSRSRPRAWTRSATALSPSTTAGA